LAVWRRCLLVLGVLALAGRLPAAEFDNRDLLHESLAFQALQDDPALAKLHLLVKVRKRVATVTGTVPTRELADRAIACLQKLPDLGEVRDQMRVGNGKSIAPRPPASDMAKKPAVSPGTLTKWPAAAKKEPSALAVWTPAPPDPNDKPKASVALLPAITTAGILASPKELSPKLSTEPSDAAAIVSAVKSLLLNEERYRRMRFEVRQNKVYLTGVVEQWADLQQLSRAITRIPGVQAVLLQDVQADLKK
jgi:BON domain